MVSDEDGLPRKMPVLPPELRSIGAAYQGAVTRHGPTPSGVGWSSRQGQELRLRVLLRILDDVPAETAVSIADIGCGYGALWPLLAEREQPAISSYTGYDIVPRMVALGRGAHGRDPRVRFLLGQMPEGPVDYAFVSGTFNYRHTASLAAWEDRVAGWLDELAGLCRRGLAFNFLHQRSSRNTASMYYTTPEAWCARAEVMARGGSVSVIDDYLPDDFTILVRMGSAGEETPGS